jgi:hypothetical protein
MRLNPESAGRILVMIICLISLPVCFSANPVQAEIFQWVDQNRIYHFDNNPPDWWQQKDKLVFFLNRVVDKPATLKKAGLPETSDDFQKKSLPEGGLDVSRNRNTLQFNSPPNQPGRNQPQTQAQTPPPPRPDPVNLIQPRDQEEMQELAAGTVVIDLTTGYYHTPDCRQIAVQGAPMIHYKLPMDKMRVAESPDVAMKSNFKPCPVCGGKPK